MKASGVNIVLLFLTIIGQAYAQGVGSIGAAYQYGFNLNPKNNREFGNTVPSGLELNFRKQKIGDQFWEKLFNYPQTGWSLSFIDHRNKYLGSTIAVNRYMNYVFMRKRKVESFVRLSAGCLYASNIYKNKDNTNKNYNNAISQHLCFSAELGWGLVVYPTSRLAFDLGATVVHFSNGAMAQPNDGLNLVMLKCGVGYSFGDRRTMSLKHPEALENDRRVKYNVYIGAGYKQIDYDNEEKYGLFTMSFNLDKKVSRVNAFNIGIDFFSNKAVQYIIEKNPDFRGKDFRRVGVSVGHEFFIHKLGILTQVGYHVYSPYPAFSPFYQKFGLKYYFNDVFFGAMNLRIFNLEISDEITWGIGVRL